MSLLLVWSLLFGLMKADELYSYNDTMNDSLYNSSSYDEFDEYEFDEFDTTEYGDDESSSNTDGIDIYSGSVSGGGVCISTVVPGYQRMYLVHDGNTASLDYECSAVWFIDHIYPNDPLCGGGICRIIQTIPGSVPPALTLNDESDSQNDGHLHHTKGRGSWFILFDNEFGDNPSDKKLFNVHLNSLLCGALSGGGGRLIWERSTVNFCGWTIETQRNLRTESMAAMAKSEMTKFGELDEMNRRRPTPRPTRRSRKPTPRPTRAPKPTQRPTRRTRKPTPRPTRTPKPTRKPTPKPNRNGMCIGQETYRGFEFLTESKSLVLERGIIKCREWRIRKEARFNCGKFDCYSIKLLPDNLYLGKDIIDGVLSFNLGRSEMWIVAESGSFVDELWALKHYQTNQFLCGRNDAGIGREGQVFFRRNGDNSGCHWIIE